MLLEQIKPGRAAAFSSLAAIGPVSIELSLPWLPRTAGSLGTDAAGIQLTMSAWLLGFALAAALSRPLAQGYGPRMMLIGGLGLYAAAAFGCVLAPGADLFTLARLLQGFGAGVALAAAALSLHGDGERTPRGAARLAAVIGFVAMIAPLASGFLAEIVGWRIGFGVMLAFAAACFLLVGPAVSEGPDSSTEEPAAWREFLRSDAYMALALGACLSFAGIFSFVSASSFVFQEGYELPPSAYGACFALAAFGFVLGSVFGGAVSNRLGIDRTLRIGAATQAIGGLGMLGGILFGPGHPAEVVAPMGLYLLGAGIVLPQTAAAVCQLFPQRAGEALSVLVICLASCGALVGVLVGAMLGGSALPLGMGVASMGVLSAIVHSATRDARRDGREEEAMADLPGF